MENKRMTVSEFVENYKSMQNKEALWKTIKLQKYVPYNIKAKTAIEIIKDNFVMNNNMVLKNTPLLYVLNRMCIIELYCYGITVSKEDALADYDMLNECGALDEIIQVIGKDVSEFDTVFNMTYNDFMENTSSPQAYVNRLISIIMKTWNEKTDYLLDVLKNTDFQDFATFISQSGEK